ncbi:MAG: outer membrane beta-barrel protein [Verrucomicrobia bacterium]|nr:outer membrane beta-barrel protein [Verrucomicrobiota bacterium]
MTMMLRMAVGCLALGLCLPAIPAQAQVEREPNAIVAFLQNYIEVGTRLTTVNLLDDSRPDDPLQVDTYLGNLNRLEAEQSLAPVKLFANFVVNPYFVVELTYDKVEARVYNSSHGTAAGFSDGTVSMAGPILTAQVRYPIQDRYVPYAGIGLAFMGAEFDEDAWWAQGWLNPTEFAAADGAAFSPDGTTRVMNVNDDTGIVLVGGFTYFITEHWAVDTMLRYMEVTTEATFVRYVNGKKERQIPGEFTLEHVAWGLGVRYSF